MLFPIDYISEIMADGNKPNRPETLEKFLEKLEELKQNTDYTAKCKACRDDYPSVYRDLTEGYCPGCAAEVFYENLEIASEDILETNYSTARRIRKSNDALVARQRESKGKTDS